MTAPVAPTQGGTTSEFKTDSTTEVLKALRRWLLDFQGDGGANARAILDERFYESRARDTQIRFPYAVLRLQTQNDGRFHGMRLNGQLEVQIFGRPWAQQPAVYAVADLFDQAMLCLCLNHQGLIICHGSQRMTLPAGGAPVDSEVITVRLSYTLAIWPAFLTSLTNVLPPE